MVGKTGENKVMKN